MQIRTDKQGEVHAKAYLLSKILLNKAVVKHLTISQVCRKIPQVLLWHQLTPELRYEHFFQQL